MNKILIAILLIILIRAFFIINHNKEINSNQTQETVMEQNTASRSGKANINEKIYSIDEIAKHETKDDCWFVIDGKVYDFSGFADKHPGGEAVYQGCGTDATKLFETRPMGSGTPHSEDARELLPEFEIGLLQTN